jgi:hypothetical protein
MTKRTDIAPWVDRIVWRKYLELHRTQFRLLVSSGALVILGFLAVALVSIKIWSYVPVSDNSGNSYTEKVLANTGMLPAPDVSTNVSVVRKLTSLIPTPGSGADLSITHNAITNANAEASLFSGETVSSKMLMMGATIAPTEVAAAKPASSVTPFTVTPRPKPTREPTTQRLQAVEHPPQELSWWQRFPWISLP